MALNPIFRPEHAVLVDRLRQARRDAGLSQRELARRLRRSQSHVCMIESGQRRVDLHELLSIAHALGREPAAFAAAIVEGMATSAAAARSTE